MRIGVQKSERVRSFVGIQRSGSRSHKAKANNADPRGCSSMTACATLAACCCATPRWIDRSCLSSMQDCLFPSVYSVSMSAWSPADTENMGRTTAGKKSPAEGVSLATQHEQSCTSWGSTSFQELTYGILGLSKLYARYERIGMKMNMS